MSNATTDQYIQEETRPGTELFYEVHELIQSKDPRTLDVIVVATLLLKTIAVNNNSDENELLVFVKGLMNAATPVTATIQ